MTDPLGTSRSLGLLYNGPKAPGLSRTTGPAPAKRNKFDSAGNLIDDATIKYDYAPNGRLDTVLSSGIRTTYQYNGLGQRIAKSRAGKSLVHYVYDESGRLLGEYAPSGQSIQETVYLDNIPVAVLRPGATSASKVDVSHVYADQINTPRVITRAIDGRMVWRWDQSDPFGLYRPDENPSGSGSFSYNPRFPGQVFDNETNNHYNYYRDYDPQTGRYIQSDPIGLEGGINTYAYVGGNPLTQIDPLGLANGPVAASMRTCSCKDILPNAIEKVDDPIYSFKSDYGFGADKN